MDPYRKMKLMFSHSYFLWIGEISEKSGGSGGSFGLTYDSDQWKLEEFATKENAYSLCEFIGKHKVLTYYAPI